MAMHQSARGHETVVSPPPGAVCAAQLDPFQRSITGPEGLVPTAVQAFQALQETPLSCTSVLTGSGSKVHTPPLRCSAKEIECKNVASNPLPTATQCDSSPHATPVRLG